MQAQNGPGMQFLGGQVNFNEGKSGDNAAGLQGRRGRTEHQQNLNKLAQQRYRQGFLLSWRAAVAIALVISTVIAVDFHSALNLISNLSFDIYQCQPSQR